MTMPAELRVCYPRIPGALIHDGKRFEGFAAPLIATPIQAITRSFNISLVSSQSMFGSLTDPVKRLYDGCIGSLQRNESDYAIVEALAPVFGPNVAQGPAIGYERMNIISYYNPVMKANDCDISQSFHSFATDVWLGVAAMSCLFIALLLMLQLVFCKEADKKKRWKKRVKRALQQSVTIVVRKLLKQSSVNSRRHDKDIRPIRLTMSLFFFWILLIFLSLIKTEKTVTKKPDTIENYDDIMSRKILPIWLAQLPDKDLFKYAPRESFQHRLWQSTVKLTRRHVARFVVDVQSERFSDVGPLMFKQSVVMIMGRGGLPLMSKNSCFMAIATGLMLHVASDERAMERIRVSVSALLPADVMRKLFGYVTLVLEAGILDKAASIGSVIETPPEFFTKMSMCMSNRVIILASPFNPLALAYFVPLLLTCIILLSIAVARLITEFANMYVSVVKNIRSQC